MDILDEQFVNGVMRNIKMETEEAVFGCQSIRYNWYGEVPSISTKDAIETKILSFFKQEWFVVDSIRISDIGVAIFINWNKTKEKVAQWHVVKTEHEENQN